MKRLFLLTVIICCVSCGGIKDPYDFEIKEKDRQVVDIPDSCAYFYDDSVKIVAVGEFANNTSFQQGKREFESAAAAAGYRGASAAYSRMMQDMTPQLSEYAQASTESVLVSMGGSKVVSRSQMEAILKEQQFQMTLADPDTVVEFGRLSGAEYIVAGSVDNIKLNYTAPVSTNYDTSNAVGLIFALGSTVYNAAVTGWVVETELTINIIDVSTGQIIASHSSIGQSHVSDASVAFSTDQAVAGAKQAMGESIYKTLSFFNRYFEMRSYINELRGNKKLARISVGRNNGVIEGDSFAVMEIVPNTDFLTGQTTCSVIETKATLTVTEFTGEDFAWAEVDGGKKQLSKVRIGSLLKRIDVKKR